MKLLIKKESEDAIIPTYAHEGDAGLDLYAMEDTILYAGIPVLIGTGISIELPVNYEAQIRSRSGLSLKNVIVVNSPGTIDCNYRGEIKVILLYNGIDSKRMIIDKGDRIAQMVINKLPKVEIIEVDNLSDSNRGSDGFGSSGIN